LLSESDRQDLELSDLEPKRGLESLIRYPHVVFCNRSGGYLFYENDEHGFRNPLGLYETGPLDIAIVEDSLYALNEAMFRLTPSASTLPVFRHTGIRDGQQEVTEAGGFDPASQAFGSDPGM